MKFITETIDNAFNMCTEELDESTGSKSLFLEGIFAQAEKKNRNGRIYPKRILEQAVDLYVRNYVNENMSMGELNHPAQPHVNPERACILIKSLNWNGNDVYGKAKILGTPQGLIVKELIKDGVKLGVSTRGLGSVKNESTGSIVENDYVITAIDVVSNPSGIDCFVNGIMENVNYYYNNGVLVEEQIDCINNNINKNNIELISNDFKNFISKCLSNI